MSQSIKFLMKKIRQDDNFPKTVYPGEFQR